MRWLLTEWVMAGDGTWAQIPVIVIGTAVFTYSTPSEYITKLTMMHADPTIADGPFHSMVGQFQDAIDQGMWDGLRRREVLE